jgi:hypothetical protein
LEKNSTLSNKVDKSFKVKTPLKEKISEVTEVQKLN